MVRLEDFFPPPGSLRPVLFQFLYGAIGRVKQGNLDGWSQMFQFLYGAIGRERDIALRVSECGFNSYMVRLEGVIAT